MKKLLWLCLILSLPAAAQVVTQTNSATFACTGVVGPYGFTFPASDSGAIDVIEQNVSTGAEITLVPTSQYTIIPVNNNYINGGQVTLVNACTTGTNLILQRNTEQTQLQLFYNNMPTLYQSLQAGLDKLTMEVIDESQFPRVTSIIPGTNVTCSPLVYGSCTGNVTINSTGGGGGGGGTVLPNPLISFTNVTSVTFPGATYGFTTKGFFYDCYDSNSHALEPQDAVPVTSGAMNFSITIYFNQSQSGFCAANANGGQPFVPSVINALRINSVYDAFNYGFNAAVAACGISPCTVAVNNQIAVTAGLTVPSNVTLFFNKGGQLNISSGQTVTINGTVSAPEDAYIFAGSGHVVLGPDTNKAWIEWFGAVGDWNGSTGTDNTNTIQACFTALTVGECWGHPLSYKVTAVLNISKSQVGFQGVATGLVNASLYPTPSPTQLVSTSSTADILHVFGTNTSVNVGFNHFANFTLSRTVSPGTNAAGMRIEYSYGATLDGITSQDSTAGFYLHGMASQGIGYIRNCVATWGYNGVTESGLSLAGFQVYSVDGVPSNSLRMRDDFVANQAGNNSGGTTYGLEMNGSELHDFMSYNFETAETNYGEYLSSSNTGFTNSSDIHIISPINDGCLTTCEYVSGVGGTIEFLGGWNYRLSSTSPVIDIESSSHVAVMNQQLYWPLGSGVGVQVANSGSIRLIGNDLGVGLATALSCSNTAASTYANNVANAFTATTIFNFAGCYSSFIGGNTINGTATNGIALDATSVNNAGLETNPFPVAALGTITSFISDSGSPANVPNIDGGINPVYRCTSSSAVYWGSTPPGGCGTPVLILRVP